MGNAHRANILRLHRHGLQKLLPPATMCLIFAGEAGLDVPCESARRPDCAPPVNTVFPYSKVNGAVAAC